MRLIKKVYFKLFNKIRYDLEKNPETSNRIYLEKGFHIDKSTKMDNARINGKVNILQGCKIIGGVIIKANSEVTIGRYTAINGPNTDLIARINRIEIGSFCSVARNVSIQEFNHKFNYASTFFMNQNIFGESLSNDITSKGNIEIGNDVWIGTQCVILSGSKIGDGAVVAANSVVTGEIPAYAIVAGSPAKVIKYRFSEEKIHEIQQLKWWEWDIDKIKENKELFLKPFN
jgi:virginiamycin A acetyltransferase